MSADNPLAQLAQALQALSTSPHDARLWSQVGFLYLKVFEVREALDTFQAAQTFNPQLPDLYFGEAIAQQQLGDTAAALAALQRAMQLSPQDQRYASAYAYLCSAAGRPAAETVAAYRAWGQRFADPLRPRFRPPAHRRAVGEKLRIGYLSADFREHALMDFFAPVLAHHNRDAFTLIALSNGAPDARTPTIRAQFDYWNDVRGLSDQAVADLMRKRGIDIAVDLSGHTDGNRLLALARQPAIAQFTWYGYNGTTGMNAIDGRLTDAIMDPNALASLSTETLYQLPTFATFAPAELAPAVGPLPALATGHITFGSLNNAQKLSTATLQTWAKILNALPSARLLLIGPHAPSSGTSAAQNLTQRLAACGLPTERVELLPRQSLADFLALGQRIDIALEPFPLSGAVTTCQSLWMGLPTLSLAGSLPFERAAAAILHAANRPEWVVDSPDAYVALALSLAAQPERLAHLRTGQRAHLQASPLFDYNEQVRALENIYQQVWAKNARPATSS